MIGKKTSEINELIRGKRNITVAWDIILSKYLSTTPKFRILKQVDYDYEQLLSKQKLEDN
jgi:plasmid maintenance system antidote protein VapI